MRRGGEGAKVVPGPSVLLQPQARWLCRAAPSHQLAKPMSMGTAGRFCGVGLLGTPLSMYTLGPMLSRPRGNHLMPEVAVGRRERASVWV